MPFNTRLSQEDLWHEGLWLWSEAPTITIQDLTTAKMPTAGATQENTTSTTTVHQGNT